MSFERGLARPARAGGPRRARPGLLAAAAAYLGSAAAPLAVDLGCGTGATVPGLRCLAAACAGGWSTAIAGLLAMRGARAARAVRRSRRISADVDGLPLAGARLVTASALLDLASRPGSRRWRSGWRRRASGSMRR